jgi:hypothetical protein
MKNEKQTMRFWRRNPLSASMIFVLLLFLLQICMSNSWKKENTLSFSSSHCHHDNVIVIVDCGEKVLKNCDADMLIVVIDARYKKNVARGRKNDFVIV